MSDRDFLTVLWEVYIAVTLTGAIVYLITKKYQLGALNYLGILLILSFLTDALSISNFFWLRLGESINPVMNIYGMIEGVIVILLYQLELSHTKRRVFNILALSFTVSVLLELFVFRGAAVYPGTTRSALGIIVTVFALLYFFKLIRDLPSKSIFRVPMFWVNCGMLIYFSGNLFLFAMADYLMYVLKDSMILYWSSHNFLGIVSYTFFAIALWQSRRNQLQAVPNSMVSDQH